MSKKLSIFTRLWDYDKYILLNHLKNIIRENIHSTNLIKKCSINLTTLVYLNTYETLYDELLKILEEMNDDEYIEIIVDDSLKYSNDSSDKLIYNVDIYNFMIILDEIIYYINKSYITDIIDRIIEDLFNYLKKLSLDNKIIQIDILEVTYSIYLIELIKTACKKIPNVKLSELTMSKLDEIKNTQKKLTTYLYGGKRIELFNRLLITAVIMCIFVIYMGVNVLNYLIDY